MISCERTYSHNTYKLASYPLSLFDKIGMRKTAKSSLYPSVNTIEIKKEFIDTHCFLFHRSIWPKNCYLWIHMSGVCVICWKTLFSETENSQTRIWENRCLNWCLIFKKPETHRQSMMKIRCFKRGGNTTIKSSVLTSKLLLWVLWKVARWWKKTWDDPCIFFNTHSYGRI